MRKVIGIIIFLATIVLGVWGGLFLFFIGGIISLVNTCKSGDFNGLIIAWSLFKILTCELWVIIPVIGFGFLKALNK